MMIWLPLTEATLPASSATSTARESQRDPAFEAGGHERRLGDEQRHGLALHVRTHQGAVGVVVLQERNQRRRDGDQLLRRNVHEIHFHRFHVHEFAALAANDAIRREMALFIHHGIGLGDGELFLAVSREVFDVVGHAAVFDFAIRRFQETEFVDARKRCQRRDQTDVRAFRGFNRTNASVVRRMHVADFKAGTIAAQTPGPESRQAAFVGQLRQRIDLIHELAQL